MGAHRAQALTSGGACIRAGWSTPGAHGGVSSPRRAVARGRGPGPRRALIEWVGSGRASQFYREERDEGEGAEPAALIVPEKPRARRTAGWQIEYD